ncbi:MAG: DNA polymerase III subunit epsilon [Candidatus Tokpelaia sp.]|uniref:DNA polymerase III subunit epsilon n=1 Tax=Candidatus Tokpelaia sp. TaxID=2233777 RepID=UPI00123B6D68|nr:DNA polymerase III subunit epsilon [Candidatus Tokpelaia sp.]KAA6206021.1 MAG: DNA polymerase III subunit epsilon [Candidatus Tokpelaia sp.]KAA6206314.1 MAG: DNA polymerase III subunit epsilon [Candidatus Tokpelaia sp.]KAA6406327.1 DNA polymerase III subunit epsilon [Candidatus Tokpelaia sp.]
MREIIFDTETTGLDSSKDRIIEIGALEYDDNRFPTGRKFHHYINPDGMKVPMEAQKIHGITDAMLADKPCFADIADEFLHFTDGALLIAHNAMFDLGFINAELVRCGKRPIEVDRIIDTLPIARRKHPGAQNNLDALCRRYGIDNSKRVLHGALLDAEILADVYVELIGGRQGALGLGRQSADSEDNAALYRLKPRPQALPPRLSAEEEAEHEQFLQKMAEGGTRALWYGGAGGKQG